MKALRRISQEGHGPKSPKKLRLQAQNCILAICFANLENLFFDSQKATRSWLLVLHAPDLVILTKLLEHPFCCLIFSATACYNQTGKNMKQDAAHEPECSHVC